MEKKLRMIRMFNESRRVLGMPLLPEPEIPADEKEKKKKFIPESFAERSLPPGDRD
ncbi:MAG: hypothetical protein WCO48_03115 [Candidatus Taylorbacteria bacterium]